MRRLADIIGDSDAQAECKLVFYKESARDFRVRGTVSAVFDLRCERCLGTYEFTLESEFTVALVSSEAEEEALLDEVEPYLIEEENLETLEFIEDEILLGLPTIARHPDKKDCNVLVMREFDPEAELDDEVPGEDKPNPFAVLESLKKH